MTHDLNIETPIRSQKFKDRIKKYLYLIGGLEHFSFSIYWECHHPNRRTHIFQRG